LSVARLALVAALFAALAACGGSEQDEVRATAFTVTWPGSPTVFNQNIDVPGTVHSVVLGNASLREGEWTCVPAHGGGSTGTITTDDGVQTGDIVVGGTVRVRYEVDGGRVALEIDNTGRSCHTPVEGEVEVVGPFRQLSDPTWSAGAVLWTD
jgi:hypothetical protein